MRVKSKLPAIEGARLSRELTIHNHDFGGVTAVVYGSKGSGKTTLFLTLCQSVQCYNIKTGVLELETSIWRGGDEDYWTWLPYERTRVFIHRDNIKTVTFRKDEDLTEYDRKDLPEIVVYKTNKELYSKLLRGGINVVYEPTTYTLTDNIKKMIQKRGVSGDEMFKNKAVDSIIWWFEFIDWLRLKKSIEHISIFIDEADQLLPVSPSGARWHLNLWFKDIMRALRKRNLSLYMACHGYTDIDGRIIPKIMYRMYMKGSCAPSTSLIFKTAPVTLPQGKYYIERDAWGWARFNKINERPRVLVMLDSPEPDPDPDDKEDIDGFEGETITVVPTIVTDPDVIMPDVDLPDDITRLLGDGCKPQDKCIVDAPEDEPSDDDYILTPPTIESVNEDWNKLKERMEKNKKQIDDYYKEEEEVTILTLDDLFEDD